MDSLHKAKSDMGQSAGIAAVASTFIGVTPHTHYTVECFGADGVLKWIEEFDNIVVTEGKNTLLDYTIKTGQASPVWYVGLKDTGTVVAGDLMNSHAGWAELGASTYSNANRPTYTPGTIAAGSVDNSASKAVFNINAPKTVYGCFLTSNNTVDGTTGKLYGAGDFGSPRSVISGDTLNVTVTLTIT